MNSGLEYIKYRWNAVGRHKIHSPFVYDFLDKCLPLQINSIDRSRLNSLCSSLKIDNRTINIVDHGAGSKKLGSSRVIRSIYKQSSSKGKYGELLYKIANHYKAKNILELGTSLGIGACYLATGAPDALITTVEGCPETFKIATENIHQFGLENINLINNTFDGFIHKDNDTLYDMIYIDGHHDGEALLHYLNRLKKNQHNNTLFILDDIRWSDSMLNAWKKIIQSPEYHVTMDLYRWGIVLPRPEQEKEHFVIRY